MGHKSSRRRLKKAKRLAAAVAGAAVMTSAMLPIVSAAEAPDTTDPAALGQPPVQQSEPAPTLPDDTRHRDATPKDQTERTKAQVRASESPVKAARQQAAEQGYNTKDANFSLLSHSDTEATVLMTTDDQSYRIKLLKNDAGEWIIGAIATVRDGQRGNDRNDREDRHDIISPVAVVKDNAARYGFDADDDRFSLLSQNNDRAIVQVRHVGGQTFKVDLERDGRSWEITTIRGIGSMKYPATYIPAKMFSHNIVVATPVTLAANQQIIFRTDAYADWTWREATYPRDMHFGIYRHNPTLFDGSEILPDAVVKALADIDYSRQMVFYANLGSVAYKGYGIGIEKVAQTGNNLVVTVRTKSPALTTETFTKAYDYIAIDRSAVDFTKAVHVHFVTPDGHALSWYTFLPQ